MKDRQPPTDEEIKEYVTQILDGADLEKTTMKMVCKQVYGHYPHFKLKHKKEFIKAIVKSVWADWKSKTKKKALAIRRHAGRTGGGPASRQTLSAVDERVLAILGPLAVEGQASVEELGFNSLGLAPTTVQLEKLTEFLEENPEIATATRWPESAQERLVRNQKWEYAASVLNLLGDANGDAESWAEYWAFKKDYLDSLIADKKAAARRPHRKMQQPQLSKVMERLINLLETCANQKVAAQPHSLHELHGDGDASR